MMTDVTLTCDVPRVGHPIHDLSNRLIDRIRQRRRRRRMTRLLDLDDQMLDDIGVSRGDLEVALRLPLSVDVATELRRMSLERRKRHM